MASGTIDIEEFENADADDFPERSDTERISSSMTRLPGRTQQHPSMTVTARSHTRTEPPFGVGRRPTTMSDAGGPYLFDVGVIALAHTAAPGRNTALSYVRDAISGDIDAIVPYSAVFGTRIANVTVQHD